MDSNYIKDKIRKLLALGTSPNENEAKLALLKAKELMIKHKLTEADIEDKNAELVHITSDEVTWTTDSGDIWIAELSSLIAENYMCIAAWRTPRGRRTHQLVVTGLEQDARICTEAIAYAVGFVRGQIRILQRRHKSMNPKSVSKSYADGFILGLSIAFDEQREENPEWALVEVKPAKVQEYENELGHKNVTTKQAAVDPLIRAKGMNDGIEFNRRKAIGNK